MKKSHCDHSSSLAICLYSRTAFGLWLASFALDNRPTSICRAKYDFHKLLCCYIRLVLPILSTTLCKPLQQHKINKSLTLTLLHTTSPKIVPRSHASWRISSLRREAATVRRQQATRDWANSTVWEPVLNSKLIPRCG